MKNGVLAWIESFGRDKRPPPPNPANLVYPESHTRIDNFHPFRAIVGLFLRDLLLDLSDL